MQPHSSPNSTLHSERREDAFRASKRNEKRLAGRVYLLVPFAEKDKAKALGAKWDRSARSWYVSAGTQLEPLARWRSRAVTWHLPEDPRAEFAAALRAAGLIIDGLPLMDGKLRRVAVEGDRKGKRSGAYVGYLNGHPAGFIQNFVAGIKTNWRSQAPRRALSAAERTRLAAQAAKTQRKREEERATLAKETAHLVEDFIRQLQLLGDDSAGHSYLERKRVCAHGIYLNSLGPLKLFGGAAKPQLWSGVGHLIVPIRDIAGRLLGAQSVAPDGRKSFPRGATLAGGHHLIGNVHATRPLLIAEGYATAATLHEATGLPAVTAFTAGNLEPVAKAYSERYPELHLIIAGDNDHRRRDMAGAHGRLRENVGRIKAEAAARAVGGIALIPRFRPGQEGSDWNDIAQQLGNHFSSAFRALLHRAGRRLTSDARRNGPDCQPNVAVHTYPRY